MKLPFYGIAIINEDDKNLKKIINNNHNTEKLYLFLKKIRKLIYLLKILFLKMNTLNLN